MVNRELNQKAEQILQEWDPFSIGVASYGTEITNVIAQLHLLDDPSMLAKQIQRIYQLTFEHWIPLENCVAVSYKLLALKFKAKSII